MDDDILIMTKTLLCHCTMRAQRPINSVQKCSAYLAFLSFDCGCRRGIIHQNFVVPQGKSS